jgi:protein-disulfide isomerase
MAARLLALACLLACLLAGPVVGPIAHAAEAAPAATGELPAALVEGLSAAQQAVVGAWAKESFCYCGCPHTVAQCLREHAGCRHAKRATTLAARLVRAGAKRADLEKALAAYYGSFERRAKLDVAAFGPPLGSPDARITFVEFSDFTCPYCQMIRAGLETFVRTRSERVKLYFKPFPIESHPGALECAQAAEWARDKGRFWAMHDAIFEHPEAHAVNDLAALAGALGLPAAELRAALEDRRYLDRIRGSQAEARAAGLKGTPTLFVSGRMLVITDLSDEGLEFTLEDEEEWQANRGWARD